MSNIAIFRYEWIHFIRSPFKVVALFLFIAAGIYGLHNGADLYHSQMAEIGKIKIETKKQIQETTAIYEEGKTGPEDRPWVDVTTPFWAAWYAVPTHFKQPSPAMVYSVGQAEQFGFYKKVTFQSSPYDSDMAEEIANPERLQSGTLDFSFVMLNLLPLLLLLQLYNLKGKEAEMGILPLIYVQTGTKANWLAIRVSFYVALLALTTFLLMLYGSLLTNVWSSATSAFIQTLAFLLIYLFAWTGIFLLILKSGQSSVINTIKMAGCWLLLTFILPALAHQLVSTVYPADLMTDWIDAKRDERQKLYDQPDSVLQAKLDQMFPEIVNSPLYKDSTRMGYARNYSSSALANELMKSMTITIVDQSKAKNNMVKKTYWLNPLAFFQNQLNSFAKTHFQDYQNYRNEIQQKIDNQINILVSDVWNDVKVNKEKYLEYHQRFQ